MTIKQFIEKAIEGGWRIQDLGFTKKNTDFVSVHISGNKIEVTTKEQYPTGQFGERREGSFWIHLREVITYPEVWQAVGKVEGWAKWTDHEYGDDGMVSIPEWHENMLRMIDALAEGKTIEEFLETL